MNTTFDQPKRNRGQATVEYILLLVVVIALIAGPLKQFSQFFNAYIEALFGNGQYIACLLETGELGGSSTGAGSSCSAAFSGSVQSALAASKAGAGKGANGGNGSNNGSSNGSSGSQGDDSSNGADSASKKPKVQAQASSSGSSDSGGGGGGDSTSGSSIPGLGGHGAGSRNKLSGSRQVVGSSSGGSKDSGESFSKMDGESFDYKELRPKKGFEIPKNGLDRRFNMVEDAEAKREQNLAPKEVSSTNARNLRAKELSFDPPRAPAAKDTDIDTEGFGFSSILKWALIAIIIIALIIVVGGQALQVSKGGDS